MASRIVMFLNDQETAVDLLYYEAIALTVVKLVRANVATPLTIGIHGDWGAGKSSVLVMVQETLNKQPNVFCLRFNGWQFQGYEDAKAVLIETVITELREARPHGDLPLRFTRTGSRQCHPSFIQARAGLSDDRLRL